jgi:hypothetical protein
MTAFVLWTATGGSGRSDHVGPYSIAASFGRIAREFVAAQGS